MKRKEFIRNISLVGVGISLAPTRLFGNSAKTTIQLPQASIHVPHGNFANTELEKVLVPELGISISVQRFMRNGIVESENDLTVYTFEKDSETLLISQQNSEIASNGSITGVSLNRLDELISLSNSSHRIEIRNNQILVSRI